MTRVPDQVFKAAAHDLLLEQVTSYAISAENPEFRVADVDKSRNIRTAIGSLVVLSTLAAAWFGITALVDQRPSQQPAVSPAIASPTPDASRTMDPIVKPLAQVVGSGKFDGPMSGDFTITQTSSGSKLHLRNFNSGGVEELNVLLAVDLASAACRGDGVGTLAGKVSDARTQIVELRDSSPQRLSDLSYMHAIGLWPLDGCSSSEPRTASRIAAASINWDVPTALRQLASKDRGAGPGAEGITDMKDGRPQRYTVSTGDRIEQVAARFDLTPDELLYLNPLRRRGDSTVLYAGEGLNLNQSDRDWFWR